MWERLSVTGRGSFTILMGPYMTESGSKTRNQDKARCSIQMEQSMMVNGKQTRFMDWVFSSLRMEIDTKEALTLVSRTDTELCISGTGTPIKASGRTTKSGAKECSTLRTGIITKEIS